MVIRNRSVRWRYWGTYFSFTVVESRHGGSRDRIFLDRSGEFQRGMSDKGTYLAVIGRAGPCVIKATATHIIPRALPFLSLLQSPTTNKYPHFFASHSISSSASNFPTSVSTLKFSIHSAYLIYRHLPSSCKSSSRPVS